MGKKRPIPVSLFKAILSPDEQVEEYNKVVKTLNNRIRKLKALGADIMIEYPSYRKATQGQNSIITAPMTVGGYFKTISKSVAGSKDTLLNYNNIRDISYNRKMFTMQERKERIAEIDRLSEKWLKDNEGRDDFGFEEYEAVLDAALYAREVSSLYYEELMYAYENGAIEDFTRESQNALWTKYGIDPHAKWTRDTIKEALGAINKEIVYLNKESYKENGGKYQKAEFKSYYDERESGGDLVESGKLTGIRQLERHAHSRYRNETHVQKNAEPKVLKLRK